MLTYEEIDKLSGIFNEAYFETDDEVRKYFTKGNMAKLYRVAARDNLTQEELDEICESIIKNHWHFSKDKDSQLTQTTGRKMTIKESYLFERNRLRHLIDAADVAYVDQNKEFKIADNVVVEQTSKLKSTPGKFFLHGIVVGNFVNENGNVLPIVAKIRLDGLPHKTARLHFKGDGKVFSEGNLFEDGTLKKGGI